MQKTLLLFLLGLVLVASISRYEREEQLYKNELIAEHKLERQLSRGSQRLPQMKISRRRGRSGRRRRWRRSSRRRRLSLPEVRSGQKQKWLGALIHRAVHFVRHVVRHHMSRFKRRLLREAARRKAEAARKKAQAQRKAAEAARLKALAERKAAEVARLKALAEKKAAEAARKKAEAERKAAEAARLKAAAERKERERVSRVAAAKKRRYENACQGVALYQHRDYHGYKVSLSLGKTSYGAKYDLKALSAYGMKNDDISSIQVPADCRVVLHWDDDFRAPSITFTHNVACLCDHRRGTSTWNDQVSAVEFYKTVSE